MFKTALLNVSRRKDSTAMTIIITAIAVLAVILILAISSCISSGLKISEERLGADVIIYPYTARIDETEFLYSGIAQMVYMDKDVIDGVLPEEDIERITPQFFLQTLPGASCCSTGKEYRIIGFDKATDFIVSPWYDTSTMQKDDMLIGDQAEGKDGMLMFLLGNTFRVVGTLAPTGSAIDQSVYIDINDAREIAHARFTLEDEYRKFDESQDLSKLVTCYLIKLRDGVSPDDFVQRVLDNGINANISSISATRSALSDQMANLAKILFAFAIVIVLLACLALYSQFKNLTGKMQREIGYLRSIGLRKKDVLRMILIQVGAMSFIGGLIGGILGMVLFKPVVTFLQSLMVLPVGSRSFGTDILWVAAGVIFSLIIGLLSSVGPILRSVRMDPTKAISEGEV
ncbi:MAG: ABC transporter permease [Oscillospiraceae bacterium]|nr:ABC transporter permease [Oscillospiraceae bacterium]